MKSIVLFLISFVIAGQAHAVNSNGFMHLWMKDGKLEKLEYFHYQLDMGHILTKSNLMNTTVRNGESFLEYRAESKDKTFVITDAVGFGKSTFSLELNKITEMFHVDYYYKDFKWELFGPSIDAFYEVLAELDNVDEANVIQKSMNKENDAAYSIGTGKGAIACYVDRGGNGRPAKPPVKACVFTEP